MWVQPVGSDPDAFLVDTGEHAGGRRCSGPPGAAGWPARLSPGGAPRHEVWLVRPDGSELHQVAGFGADTADNMRWLPGRSLLAVTENLTTTLVIDPVTGERTVVAEGELLSLFDVSTDRRRALLRHGPRGSRYIAVRDLVTGVDEYVTSGEEAVLPAAGSRERGRRRDGGGWKLMRRRCSRLVGPRLLVGGVVGRRSGRGNGGRDEGGGG